LILCSSTFWPCCPQHCFSCRSIEKNGKDQDFVFYCSNSRNAYPNNQSSIWRAIAFATEKQMIENINQACDSGHYSHKQTLTQSVAIQVVAYQNNCMVLPNCKKNTQTLFLHSSMQQTKFCTLSCVNMKNVYICETSNLLDQGLQFKLLF